MSQQRVSNKEKSEQKTKTESASKKISSTKTSRGSKKSFGIQFKNIFKSPFKIQWSAVSDSDRDAIVQAITNTIPKRRRQRRRTKQNQKHASTNAKTSSSTFPTTTTTTTTTTDPQTSAVRYSEELALGLNEVTRALEKGTARLVVVCRDVHNPVLIQHLPVLAQHRQVPICLLPSSPFTLAQFFGLRTLIAFAFKNVPNSKYDELVKFISARTSRVEVEWLRARHNVMLFPLKVQQRTVLKKRKLSSQQDSTISSSPVSSPPQKKRTKESTKTYTIPQQTTTETKLQLPDLSQKNENT